jgi:heavy metal translocating P-type ATPase
MSEAGSRECCAFCALPLPRRWGRARLDQQAATEPQYCCYGCALAHAATTAGAPTGEARALLTRLGVGIFLTMNVMVFSMDLWTQDVYAGETHLANTLAEPLREVFRYLCLLLSLPVVWLLGRPLANSAWQNLRRGGASTDLLMVLGVAAAIAYSTISVLRGSGHVYFEVACVVLVMVTVGRWLDATGKLQTTAALDALERLLPDRVRVLRDGLPQMISSEEVRRGDCLHVLAGERFAFDGLLHAGTADVDEQVITGESRPVTKAVGDQVYAGCVNLDGDLFVTVTAERNEGALARMIEMVRAARQAKGYHARLVDRVSAWFLPTVAVLATATFGVHWARAGFEQGLLAGLAVSLIACPCALALATPMAVWAALGRASQQHVLVRSGEVLERLAQVRAVAFDKTGTLTTGVARVEGLLTEGSLTDGAQNPAGALSIGARAFVERAGALAARSGHPFSTAIAEFARGECMNLTTTANDQVRVQTLPGRGIRAQLPDVGAALLGNLRLMQENGLTMSATVAAAVAQAETSGRSLVCAGWQGQVQGVFILNEQPRAEALAAINHLKQQGVYVCLLTGDHRSRAKRLADTFDIDFEAELLPDDKLAAIARLREQWGAVAMVGDGINDSPALAAADVGLAMGCGADVSRQSAGVCLLGNQLDRVPEMIELARSTVTVIRQNLFWAFFYNVGGIGLATLGWLNPIWAAVAMVTSSVLVIGNSLRLRPTTPATVDFLDTKENRARDDATSDIAERVLEEQAA